MDEQSFLADEKEVAANPLQIRDLNIYACYKKQQAYTIKTLIINHLNTGHKHTLRCCGTESVAGILHQRLIGGKFCRRNREDALVFRKSTAGE